MKLLYFTLCDLETEGLGIQKKVHQQIDCFEKNGFEVSVLAPYDGMLCLTDKRGKREITQRSKKLWRGLNSKQLINILCSFKYDAIYIRYQNTDYYFNRLLKMWKTMGTKIYIEVPTFPYDEEYKNTRAILKMRLMIDKMYRLSMKKYVDYIVTYSQHDCIFGISTIKTVNGIDFSTENIRNIRNPDQTLHFIAVSTMAFWHGYDRLIEGMGEYYEKGGQDKIMVHMVGDGDEYDRYKQLTRQYNLEDKIIFYGKRKGKALLEIYDKCDIAISSLGLHRLGLSYISVLKAREYAAKGFPVVTSCQIDIFPPNECPYVCMLSGDDTPASIQTIIDFYNELTHRYETTIQLAEHIRQYAFAKADISVSLQPVMSSMKSEFGREI